MEHANDQLSNATLCLVDANFIRMKLSRRLTPARCHESNPVNYAEQSRSLILPAKCAEAALIQKDTNIDIWLQCRYVLTIIKNTVRLLVYLDLDC